mgnify:CR=1 FL=1
MGFLRTEFNFIAYFYSSILDSVFSEWYAITVLYGKNARFWQKLLYREAKLAKFWQVFVKIRAKNSNLRKFVCHKMPNRDGFGKIRNFCAVLPAILKV